MYLEFLVYITKSFIVGSKKQGSSTYLRDMSKVRALWLMAMPGLVENQALSMSLLGPVFVMF